MPRGRPSIEKLVRALTEQHRARATETLDGWAAISRQRASLARAVARSESETPSDVPASAQRVRSEFFRAALDGLDAAIVAHGAAGPRAVRKAAGGYTQRGAALYAIELFEIALGHLDRGARVPADVREGLAIAHGYGDELRWFERPARANGWSWARDALNDELVHRARGAEGIRAAAFQATAILFDVSVATVKRWLRADRTRRRSR